MISVSLLKRVCEERLCVLKEQISADPNTVISVSGNVSCPLPQTKHTRDGGSHSLQLCKCGGCMEERPCRGPVLFLDPLITFSVPEYFDDVA